ncbi:MAG: hypothetical protein ACLR53_07210 [Evtepia gabavorous]
MKPAVSTLTISFEAPFWVAYERKRKACTGLQDSLWAEPRIMRSMPFSSGIGKT